MAPQYLVAPVAIGMAVFRAIMVEELIFIVKVQITV